MYTRVPVGPFGAAPVARFRLNWRRSFRFSKLSKISSRRLKSRATPRDLDVDDVVTETGTTAPVAAAASSSGDAIRPGNKERDDDPPRLAVPAGSDHAYGTRWARAALTGQTRSPLTERLQILMVGSTTPATFAGWGEAMAVSTAPIMKPDALVPLERRWQSP